MAIFVQTILMKFFIFFLNLFILNIGLFVKANLFTPLKSSSFESKSKKQNQFHEALATDDVPICALIRILYSLKSETSKPSTLTFMIVSLIESFFCDTHYFHLTTKKGIHSTLIENRMMTEQLAVVFVEDMTWMHLLFMLCDSQMLGLVKGCTRIVLSLLRLTAKHHRRMIEDQARFQGFFFVLLFFFEIYFFLFFFANHILFIYFLCFSWGLKFI